MGQISYSACVRLRQYTCWNILFLLKIVPYSFPCFKRSDDLKTNTSFLPLFSTERRSHHDPFETTSATFLESAMTSISPRPSQPAPLLRLHPGREA